MYYIINQNNQIVAVDPKLLAELQVDDANTFYKKLSLDEIHFDLSDETVAITTDGATHYFRVTVSPMDGMLGDIRLVDVGLPVAAPQTENESTTDTDMINFDELDLFGENTAEEQTLSQQDETLLPISDSIETATTSKEEDELFELILPSDADNAIDEISHTKNTEHTSQTETESILSTEEKETPIYIDIDRISESIGISPEDYTLFLNEYIDTALTFEEALQSQNEAEKEEALQTLSHLSNVLQLPVVGEALTQLKSAPLPEQENAIANFFAILGRLTTSRFEEEEPSPEQTATQDKPLTEETPEISEVSSTEQRAPIDLSDVEPVHFDFQLEEAAKDLSLPVELIEEFVHDFIQQAHEETEKMLAAYEKGDLETIQKIGHLLKGTSSNLRITPLADTLYEIQFNEDIDRVPELVRNYWAHFLSLEKQIELIKNK